MVDRFNNRKIINDPIYGFIRVPSSLIYKIIDHPFFQRLRRIKQTGFTSLVYPGANHTRFQHSLGAMDLMRRAISALRNKGYEITEEEEHAALIAILLHDIGHGPFSHSLEHSIVKDVSHEELSILFMKRINKEFDGELDLAIQIFEGTYKKKFLHQLVSSQLDMDRLDYLKRDSFYTGVSEGVVSVDRIISMLEVVNDELAVEQKGIYNIENFIVARRLMYWQVYLHKTVIVSETLLINILLRARELVHNGVEVWATPALKYFLKKHYNKEDFQDLSVLTMFSQLDDYDVMISIKQWLNHPDKILSMLADNIINRKLPAIILQKDHFKIDEIIKLRKRASQLYDISEEEVDYIINYDHTSNLAYNPELGRINILFRDGHVEDVSNAADQLNISVLSHSVVKHFLIYPKELRD
ncbi:MAG: HD domain-containing protein [Hyphomicrobiales bacterium]